MSKAYDRVEWAFLECMMLRLGFSVNWVDLILRCVSSVSYSFLVNGEVFGKVCPSRGLRQGDPLSPYLFIICSEGLSGLISAAESDGRLVGLRCGRSGPRISHLFFADDSLLFFRASPIDCSAVGSILDIYSKASGQVINFDKSALCASKQVAPGVSSGLALSLGVNLVPCHAKYLGLPCVATRNRRNLFDGIKTRVWQKLCGWSSKLFSAGGKEILIKAVIQAIPSYSMNLFRLPSSLIGELHRMMARFWWGSSDDKQRIHWCRWKSLCGNKLEGGLGFRELSHFNQALLAKQGWRLINQPGSLAGRVLKHIYFPRTSFLRAKVTASASLVWRSILWGRELIEKGSRWRVGSGSSVSILQDRWLPRPSSFKIIASCSLAGDAMVASLKSASGAWDLALVRSSFAPIDADCILSLPTSVRSCPDKLMWHHSKDGMYSVKSGYWLAASLARDEASSSSPSAGSSWWKFLWGLNIPAKVRMFVWRACRNLLPTRSLLAARRVPVGAGCPLCDAAVESVLHSLWLCSSLAESKAAVPFLASLRLPAAGSFLDFILACFSSLLVHEMELLLVLLWRFWFRRNHAVHSAPLLSVEDTVGWSERFLVDFQAAVAVPSVRCELVVERWRAPSPGWFKINSDVAVDVRGRRLGFGVVIRDYTGKVLVSYTSLLLGLFSSDIGEALAILRGLRLAIDMGLSTVCVESDAASVVKQLSSRVSSCSDIGLILDDILSLVVNFADLSFSSVRRSANIVAHGLAKFALSYQPVGVRLGSVPSSLALAVLDDSRGYP
ncbi:hypothetical protein ACOSQ4_009744 [Xanthoceras sorbifolium]